MFIRRGGVFARPVSRYIFAILVIGVTLLLRLLLFRSLTNGTPFLLFFGSVAFVSWYAGRGPAYLSAVVSALLVLRLFIKPTNTFSVDPLSLLKVTLFTIESGGLISIIENGKTAKDKARASEAKQAEAYKKLNEFNEERTRLLLEAQNALKVRELLFSVASHEINNPLSAIKMNLEIILKYAAVGNITMAEMVKRIEKASNTLDRINRIVDDFLDISRITTNKIDLHFDVFDICDSVKDVCERYELLSNNTIILEVPTRHIYGTWDKGRVEQIVSNVVSNAIKYGNGKPIEVYVDGDHEKAYVIVKDQGVGISEEDKIRIFDKFERAVNTDKRIGGLGLGLWITRQLVTAMGGEIRVENNTDKGSVFTIELPTNLIENIE
jgi:signal transduction histidine kinase